MRTPHCIQDTSPGPQGVHIRGVPLYTGHFTRSPRCPQSWGSTVYWTLHQVPKVSTVVGFYCILDTSPGPQGVHSRGVPLHTGHFTRSPRCPQSWGSTAYRTLHQVPKVSTIVGFHCIQDTSPGPQGVHNRGVPLHTGHFTRSPRCPQSWGSTAYRTLHQVPKVSTIVGFHCIQDTSPGPQGVHSRGVPLYTGHFTRSPRCPQ